ncbi:Gfo/Idh/MocA family oxidoreductase [Planctomycetales bacterium ZRK34]|nr:Gfo/Idh/MocA family oxidoreductase [Planctomycetales bacterium ZRK34]
MKPITRRTFVSCAGQCSAALATATMLGPSRLARGQSANDQVRVAILGTGGKGTQHVGNFSAVPGVKVVTVCDADRDRAAAAAKKHEALKLETETDLRRVLDRKDIDAVCIATPNHWHALATVWACEAGKDVYVEKPVAHDIWQGQQMIAAARRHDRIVQAGTQRRSDPGWKQAIQTIHSGEFGRILRVRLPFYSLRQSIGHVDAPQAPPSSVDYNLWAGPAPMSPIMRKRFHYDWHWFWETGNGELGNNGPHILDLARWAIGADALPRSIVSAGGRYVWNDNGQTPNTHVVYYDYEPAPIIIEIRNLPKQTGVRASDVMQQLRAGVIIECEGATFRGLNGGAFYDDKGERIRKVDGDNGRGHPANFIAAVRSRKRSDLNCEIAEGYLSTALCLVGNISHRVGAAASTEKLNSPDKLFSDAVDRMVQHLQANDVDVTKHPLTLGATLQIDPKAQRFINTPQAESANALLRKSCRAPFVFPETA